jgi:hypothetical protein
LRNQLRDVLVDRANCDRALTDGASYALDRTVAYVAHGKHAGDLGRVFRQIQGGLPGGVGSSNDVHVLASDGARFRTGGSIEHARANQSVERRNPQLKPGPV